MKGTQAISIVILIVALLLSSLSIAIMFSLKDSGVQQNATNVNYKTTNQQNASLSIFIEGHGGER